MKITETLREDGLHIISCRIPHSKKVRVKLISEVGSAYDPPEKDGHFHYFEHMAFKGTARRTLADIASHRKKNLLSWGASTGRIVTEYHGESVAKKLLQLCDLLCDLYCNSIFPEEELIREKEVILNEIVRDNDNDSYAAHFALWKSLWQENPLRKFGVGTPEGVVKVTRQDLQKAHRYWYVPCNTLVLCAGNLHHADFEQAINEHISQQKNIAVVHSLWRDEYNSPPLEKEIILERPGREKAIVLFGWKFPFLPNNQEELTQNFLQYVIGRGTGSLLWDEIREKRGYAYTLSARISDNYPLGNYFWIQIETQPKRIEKVRDIVRRTLSQSLTVYPHFSELKEWFYDWYSLGYEDNLESYLSYIFNALNKKQNPQSLLRYFPLRLKQIKKMTLEEINALHIRTFSEDKMVTVVVKPT